MGVTLSIIAVLFLVVVLFIVRRNKTPGGKRPDERRPKSASTDHSFHAVSINYAQGACKAAMELEGRRFLSNAAPKLPLADCDVLECKCRFTHHKDRRKGEDRRNPYMQTFGGVGSGTGRHAKEKRGERDDRRKKSKKDL